MYRFKQTVYSMKGGKTYRAGTIVPEDFSSPEGLAEMVKSGDIEDMASPVVPETENSSEKPNTKKVKP